MPFEVTAKMKNKIKASNGLTLVNANCAVLFLASRGSGRSLVRALYLVNKTKCRVDTNDERYSSMRCSFLNVVPIRVTSMCTDKKELSLRSLETVVVFNRIICTIIRNYEAIFNCQPDNLATGLPDGVFRSLAKSCCV